jgi:hypothetical protein
MIRKEGSFWALSSYLSRKNLVGGSTFLTKSEVAEASQGQIPLLLLIRIFN